MIQATTLAFLKQLKTNNTRDWFEAHRAQYEAAKANYLELLEAFLLQLKTIDPAAADQAAKACLFRINRDVRFSANKSPYKTNLGASINPGGRKSSIPGIYLHLEPGASFVAGGSYLPEPGALAAIRQEIDYNAKEFSAILQNKTFQKHFGQLDPEHRLKTAPKGYPKDHPMLEALRLKSFIVYKPISDELLQGKGLIKELSQAAQAMMPLLHFLRRALD